MVFIAIIAFFIALILGFLVLDFFTFTPVVFIAFIPFMAFIAFVVMLAAFLAFRAILQV